MLVPLLAAWLVPLAAQTSTIQPAEEYYKVYTEHPRLFLRPQRLKLLRREKERRSMRWLQFETLMEGKAPMPEPGFAHALYYQVTDAEIHGREAVRWALGPGSDLRQLALVFDWCQPVLSAAQSKALAAKLQKGIQAAARSSDLGIIRARTLAAVALADHAPDSGDLEWLVRTWWRGQMAAALRAGRNAVTRDDAYPLFEFLHAVRDNLYIDLRDPVPGFFKTFPIFHLLSHYPAAYAAAENDYRVPAIREVAEPDLTRAALSRAAELIMVAYDNNAPESQVLQGWLMHDRFLLRGTLGITYEFLWANPYQPGLSYYHVPLIHHDELFGRLFVRSSWDDTATWVGYFDGVLQRFADGWPTVLRPELEHAPIELPDAVILFGAGLQRFTLELTEPAEVFLVGLRPRQAYDIEIDDREIFEATTDAGGILTLKLPEKVRLGVRMRPVARASNGVP